MASTHKFDVVIIGAGIAGSALAVALSGEGLSIAVVEAQAIQRKPLPEARDLSSFDSRVSALTPKSIGLLTRLGAWDTISGYRHLPYGHMTVWDAEGTGRIEFDCDELDVPALGHIVENRAIVDGLLEQLEARPEICCFSPQRLERCERQDSGEILVQLDDGTEIGASLLVGADGALSRVRDMMEFKMREWDYGHRAIVATVQVAQSHQDTAWQRFLPSGPLALLPLPGTPDTHFCSIVWSVEDARADELLQLDDEAFCRELTRAFEGNLGGVVGSSPRFAFPLRQRHAIDYVQPGVALVADAAHTIHPLAGQGINLGLQDVGALAEEIIAAHRRGVSPGQAEVLARYQRRRKGENLLMMGAMDGFKRLFEHEALPVRWLRNAGMRGVGLMGPLKQRLMRHAMGIG